MEETNAASIAGILVPITSILRNTSFLAYDPIGDKYASPQVANLSLKYQVRINLLIDELTANRDGLLGDIGKPQLEDIQETFDEMVPLLSFDQKTLLYRTMAHIYYLLNQVGGRYDFDLPTEHYPEGWNGVNLLCRKTSELMSEGTALTA